MSWFQALSNTVADAGTAVQRAGSAVVSSAKSTAVQLVSSVKSTFEKVKSASGDTYDAAKVRMAETYSDAKAAGSQAATRVESAATALKQTFTPRPAAPVMACSAQGGPPLQPDKRTPCDLASFSLTATGGDHKEHTFNTARRLIGDPLPANTPQAARVALASADFYVELLGTDGGPGASNAVASVSAQASFAAKCGRSDHRQALLVDAQRMLGLQPIAGCMILPGPASGTGRRDLKSLISGAGRDYSVIANSCGNPVAGDASGKPAFSAHVKVLPFQDWLISFNSPNGFSIGYDREGGYQTSKATETKVGGVTTFKNSQVRDFYGTLTKTAGSTAGGYYNERTLNVQTTSAGQKSSMTRSATVSSFFTKEEISEKVSREGDGAYVTSSVNYEKEFQSRGFKFEVKNNGKSFLDTETLIKDVETVVSAAQDFVDVLKGLPKAGYWIEGSVNLLALSAEYHWKRKPIGHKGPRSVTVGNSWSLKLSGRLVQATLTVGAGVKMNALSSIGGGAAVYAYLAGSITMDVSVSKRWEGEEDPSDRPPEKVAQGSVEFEATVHGKASVAGWGYEYQRTAGIKGEITAAPQLVRDGAMITVEASLGRWRYTVVVQTDLGGIPEQYEIDDLWAWKPNRLTEAQIASKDENTIAKKTWKVLFQTHSPYLQAL